LSRRGIQLEKQLKKINQSKFTVKFDGIWGLERRFWPKNADLASIKTAHPQKNAKKTPEK